MKLQINKQQFMKDIEKISKALNTSNALPQLQGILITATESNIQLLASDGNLSIKHIIENSEATKVLTPGKVLVPGKLFKDIISKQDSQVGIQREGDILYVVSNGSKTTLNLLNEEEYPTISFDTLGKELVVDADKLRNVIKDVSFAAAENDKRLILNGVNLKAQEGKLIATATNSFRLAQEIINIDSNASFDVTIFSKNLKDFLPNSAKGQITIMVDDNKIVTKIQNTTTSSRIIDGVYPDIQRLIPNEFNHVVTVDAKEIEKVVDRATVVSNDSKKVIRFSVAEDRIVIESRKAEIGESKVKTDQFALEGTPIDIAFNAQFLKDAINKFSGEIQIKFVSSQRPFIITSNNKEELTQLILPHRSY